ncbi:hypothetical protein PFISCL1PPCAC_19386 [Pristionchus fissidentatus]|uniref:CUB domain-containing protein n=1 Tax=Pristionchus fissidentatus TaxID=1538716 RepID=A0AAV5WBW2_9BILA|nr:hypothetical protein PFISCL1PPCAC_19386 [Pristionchus fissidentatus]
MRYRIPIAMARLVAVLQVVSPTKGPTRAVPVCGAEFELIDNNSHIRSQSSRDHIAALPSIGDSLAVSLPYNKSSESLRCSLLIQSCPSCLISIDLASNLTTLTKNQPVPPPACLDSHIDDACFALNFIEDSADSPSSFYRSIAIWSIINNDETKFLSSGSSIRIVVELWSIENDKSLQKFIKSVFPLRINIVDNGEKREGMKKVMNLTTTNDYIQSPRFPSAYPRDIEKKYTLSNADPSGFVRISFDDFHIDSQSELEVLDSDGSSLFTSISDFRRPPAMKSRGREMTVNMRGNGGTKEIGFRAKFDFVNDTQWPEMPSDELCDLTVDGYGGEITLNGKTELIDKNIDCIFVIQRRNSIVGRSYDRIFMRIEDFRLRGDNLRLEVREGAYSTGDSLISLFDAQQTDELLAKQPKNGFTVSSDEPAFYIRLRGHLKSTAGLHIAYTLFYRWAGPICPGSAEFRCANQRCIKASLRCDGIDNCGDKSDEVECDGSTSISDLSAMIGGLPAVNQPHLDFRPESDISALLALVLGICGVVVLLLVTVTVVLKVYDRRRQRGRRVPTVDASGASLPHHNEVSPSIQTVGERRFYVLPETQISVIEAPPCYDDALKHPTVPTGNSASYTNGAFVGGPPPDISSVDSTARVDTPVPSFDENLEEIKDHRPSQSSLNGANEEDRPSSSTGSPSRPPRKIDNE